MKLCSEEKDALMNIAKQYVETLNLSQKEREEVAYVIEGYIVEIETLEKRIKQLEDFALSCETEVEMQRLIVERRSIGAIDWEVVAHPVNDVKQATKVLQMLLNAESGKRYKGQFRLVRETREILQESQ